MLPTRASCCKRCGHRARVGRLHHERVAAVSSEHTSHVAQLASPDTRLSAAAVLVWPLFQRFHGGGRCDALARGSLTATSAREGHMTIRDRRIARLLAIAAIGGCAMFGWTTRAAAFCGFYVTGADTSLYA